MHARSKGGSQTCQSGQFLSGDAGKSACASETGVIAAANHVSNHGSEKFKLKYGPDGCEGCREICVLIGRPQHCRLHCASQ